MASLLEQINKALAHGILAIVSVSVLVCVFICFLLPQSVRIEDRKEFAFMWNGQQYSFIDFPQG